MPPSVLVRHSHEPMYKHTPLVPQIHGGLFALRVFAVVIKRTRVDSSRYDGERSHKLLFGFERRLALLFAPKGRSRLTQRPQDHGGGAPDARVVQPLEELRGVVVRLLKSPGLALRAVDRAEGHPVDLHNRILSTPPAGVRVPDHAMQRPGEIRPPLLVLLTFQHYPPVPPAALHWLCLGRLLATLRVLRVHQQNSS